MGEVALEHATLQVLAHMQHIEVLLNRGAVLTADQRFRLERTIERSKEALDDQQRTTGDATGECPGIHRPSGNAELRINA